MNGDEQSNRSRDQSHESYEQGWLWRSDEEAVIYSVADETVRLNGEVQSSRSREQETDTEEHASLINMHCKANDDVIEFDRLYSTELNQNYGPWV